MSIIDTLITDRTGGAYEAADLTRVEAAVAYLTELLREHGYMAATQIRQEEWRITEYLTAADAERYLGNVRALVEALGVLPGTPELPNSISNLTYQGANDIERILVDLHTLIQNVTRVIDLGWSMSLAHTGLYGGL